MMGVSQETRDKLAYARAVIDDLKQLTLRKEEAESLDWLFAEAERLNQDISWALREYAGDHDAVDAEISEAGRGVPMVCDAMAKRNYVIKFLTKQRQREQEMIEGLQADNVRLLDKLAKIGEAVPVS